MAVESQFYWNYFNAFLATVELQQTKQVLGQKEDVEPVVAAGGSPVFISQNIQ